MADVTQAMQAKSDQLNATDIIGFEPVIRIRDVRVQQGKEQPVWVYFDGDNNRPWKPSKGMIRILSGAWGTESDLWIGKSAQLYFEPSVKYAGQDVGGIRIRALSDIDQRGLVFALTINRQKREPYHVKPLVVQQAIYPADKFNSAFASMAAKMASGEMSLQQVIAKCQQTGQLSSEQLARLEAAAPVEIQHDDEIEL